MREILHALNQIACLRPAATAISDDLQSLSYGELANRAASLSFALKEAPQTIAIFAPNSVQWIIADLALALAGKTMVPLPTFFSTDQLTHIVQDSGAKLILTTQDLMPKAKTLNKPIRLLSDSVESQAFPQDLSLSEQSQRIIYTSGTTGAPKGVRIGSSQISASAKGLVKASQADEKDRYLSILPFSLLLEQIAAICVPLLAGAPIVIAPNAANAATHGDLKPLIQAFEKHQPTVSVMVPQLLGAWVQGLLAMRMNAPQSLRFIAVGGAPVSPALSETAWQLGIPVHEGYGLSECCSVVSVNRPSARQPGTVGKPIEGTEISIVDDEIVITGPTVMQGYLGREDGKSQTWPTGDLGKINENGNLIIFGRKDNLIVTQNGRNISPEWIETMAQDVSGVQTVKLHLTDQQKLTLSVTATSDVDVYSLEQSIRGCLNSAPEYAQPEIISIAKATN